MKKILITGQNSYIGNETEKYLLETEPGRYEITKISLRSCEWEKMSFAGFDVVLHVAGIAHVDVEHASEQVKAEYYRVNTRLTAAAAAKAKADGVGCFIYLSSMIVYGGCALAGKKRRITSRTQPKPSNFYGDSKWKAEQKIRPMAEEGFQVIILRPPFVYGKGSKGNYAVLSKLAGKLPVFPKSSNERSMIYIGNLCECIRRCIEWETYVKKKNQYGILCCPQNAQLVSTGQLVKEIGNSRGRNIKLIGGLNGFLEVLCRMPGKIGRLSEKAFGSMAYDPQFSISVIGGYQKYQFKESIRLTEQ